MGSPFVNRALQKNFMMFACVRRGGGHLSLLSSFLSSSSSSPFNSTALYSSSLVMKDVRALYSRRLLPLVPPAPHLCSVRQLSTQVGNEGVHTPVQAASSEGTPSSSSSTQNDNYNQDNKNNKEDTTTNNHNTNNSDNKNNSQGNSKAKDQEGTQQSLKTNNVDSLKATEVGDIVYLGNEPYIFDGKQTMKASLSASSSSSSSSSSTSSSSTPTSSPSTSHTVPSNSNENPQSSSKTPGSAPLVSSLGSSKDLPQRRCLGQLRELQFHDIISSPPSLDVRAFLLKELETYGYLFVRNLHDRNQVLKARSKVLQHVAALGGKLDPTFEPEAGVPASNISAKDLPFLEGRNEVTHSAELLSVLEGPRAKGFFQLLFGEDVGLFDYKWLRLVPPGSYTGAHMDSVYMSRGSSRLLSMWTPLGDTPMRMGTVAVYERSLSLPSFSYVRRTYGELDVEAAKLKGSGWFTSYASEIDDRFGQPGADGACAHVGGWKSSDFRAGDVLIFPMRSFHMSTLNTTKLLRVSCDTRFFPLKEGGDARYMGNAEGHGKASFGAHAVSPASPSEVTMETLKASWGFMPYPPPSS